MTKGRTAVVRRALALSVATALLAAASCGRREPRGTGPVTLRIAGYTAAREVYAAAVLPAFARSWKARTGQEVVFEDSYVASRTQAQAILDGSGADVAALALEPDVDLLVQAGFVDPDWRFSETGGIACRSVVALAVRPGNPLGLRDWPDLARDGVRVVTPDPHTSGGGRWNVAAIYGAAMRGHAGARKNRTDDASALLARVFRNVLPMERGARESFERFERGEGDVAITYESEALAAARSGAAVEVVVPASTAIVELPVAMVRKNVEAHGVRDVAEAFVAFLKTDEAQRAFAEYGLRPVDERVAADTRDRFPPAADLWTIGALGGWTPAANELFAQEGAFTRVYASLHAAE